MSIVLAVLFTVSFSINCVIVWYVLKLIKRFVEIEEAFIIFDQQITEFEQHLQQIYELEAFYGDTTLEALIKHTKFITEAYADLKEDYTLLSGEFDATPEERKEEPKRFEFKPNRKQ